MIKEPSIKSYQESAIKKEAEGIAGSLNKIASGELPLIKFDTSLVHKLEQIFVKEQNHTPEVKAGQEYFSAISTINNAIEDIGKKEMISQTEQELLDKLADFFSYAIKTTPNVEQAATIISTLENVKSKKAVYLLEDFYKNPDDFINPKEKSILADSAFIQNNATVNEKGAAIESRESLIKRYVEENLKPQSIRSSIKLKTWMELEKSPEEQAFYDAHREVF